MKKVIISFAALSLLFACSDSSTTVEKKDGDVVSSIASDSKTDAELEAELERIAKEEEKRLAEQAFNTKIESGVIHLQLPIENC